MLISCEKCSTTYVLDDGLIPPGGAPVQCTRCGNVFTAKPGGGSEPTPAPPPRSDAGSSTMMFGVPPAAAAPPPTSRAASQTMVFGSAPVAAPASPNTTMMFGTPASIAAQAAADAAPVASPKLNQTMAFGTAAPAAPKPPPPTFGPAHGAGGSKEVVFGAPQTGSAGAPPSHNQTMMFGLNPAAAPAAAPASKPGSTAMFGAVQPAAASKAPATTMMFGKPPEAPAPAESLNKTMAFGTPVLPPPPGSVGKSTMIFGAADAKPLPKVTAGGAPVAKITESTVRVDLDAMMRERDGQAPAPSGEAPPDRHNRTQLFAMNDSRGGEKTPPEAFATPLAGSEAVLNATPSEPVPSVRQERTQLFSMSPSGKPSSRDVGDVTLPPDSAMRTTMMFGAPNNADTAPGLPGLTPEMLKVPITSSTTQTGPNLSPVGSRDIHESPLERTFETTDTSQPIRSSDSSQDLAPAGEESVDGNEQAFAAIESSTRRRNMIAVIVLLVAVLAAGGAVVWQFFLRPMTEPQKVQVPKTAPAVPGKAPKTE